MRHNSDLTPEEGARLVANLTGTLEALVPLVQKDFDLCEGCVLGTMIAVLEARHEQLRQLMIESKAAVQH